MQKINSRDISEDAWASPRGTFACFSRELSVALGRKADSTDLLEQHPFDVEICRVPAGAAMCPYHSHSAQWEFYHVLEGRGTVRDETGRHPVGTGDAFIYKPGEPHQIINDSEGDLVFLIIADNPAGDSCHYPDSNKYLLRSPRRIILADAVEVPYLHGEEAS